MFNKKKNIKYYNKNIRECSEDTYTWQELNCFYRPFAISMGRERYNMFLLLVSLYMTHKNVENGKILFNRLHPALSYFDSELKNVLNAHIIVEEYSSKKDMYRKVEAALSEQCAVIVPYDLYVMPYSRSYMEQHHRHYILIKGFDSDKGIFYILDNMQNNLGESTSYTDFMMQYRQMYIGADSFHRVYDVMCSSKPYFWKVKCMGKNNDVKENVRKYLIKVLEGFVYGDINPYYVEWDMIERPADGHMLDMVEQINQRNVYYGEIIKYINDMACCKNSELILTAEELKKNWNIIKIQLMRGHKDVGQKLQENIELEKKWHNDVLDILKGITTHITESQKETEYLIVNELNADMKQSDNKWEIKLSPDTVYDTWNLKDDACQILYPLEKSVLEIEAQLYKKSVTAGSGFHIGLILKSDSGEKILYGNSRNIHLAIFQPEKEDYELYQSDYVFEENDMFRVEFNYGKQQNSSVICTFYINDSLKGQWKEVYSTDIGFIPDYAGVFVKSWERCECEVVAEIKIKKNNKLRSNI
ncbi:MAG: BtrH N-terminal domain-containing protein [Lachnospiraceae bacterium]|nr:BtrH N-terminal domain-containing protein [Lachnospiraceae bacterium]